MMQLNIAQKDATWISHFF